MLANFLGVLPILTPPLCALAFIMCSKSNNLVVFVLDLMSAYEGEHMTSYFFIVLEMEHFESKSGSPFKSSKVRWNNNKSLHSKVAWVRSRIIRIFHTFIFIYFPYKQ
jgi:hypothetical protein